MLNIKEIRQKSGFNQKEVANALNIPPNTFCQYENNRREPDFETLKKIADYFNVSTDVLLGRKAHDPDYKWMSDNSMYPYGSNIKKIPVLGYVAAGKPILAEEHIIDYTYTDLEDNGDEYFALKVKGDSMNAARINDGDIVIVRIQPTCENGEIVVVRVDNENATVKRFFQNGNIIHLIPQSFNPEHQVQEYNLKNTKIDIIGKVVECKIKF